MKKIASRKIRLPEWFRQDIPDAGALGLLCSLKKAGVRTVCLEARCPNWYRCFLKKTLAFIILGDICTRDCWFCAVKKAKGKTLYLDKQEPYRILKITEQLQLGFVIITSVSRDDLDDCGAGQFAKTIDLIHNYNKNITVEVLIPDFLGPALKKVVIAHPNILAHNLETVPRLYTSVRKGVGYQRSLQVIAQAKWLQPNLITKSSLLLGMGEREDEVIRVMDDLLNVDCDILVLGQYLAPTLRHYPVREFISIGQFNRYKEIGLRVGFRAVLSSPLARTSFRAQEVYNEVTEKLRNL